MAPSLYAPLPADRFNIRLIKLQPSDNPSAPILCQLVTYPINSDRPGAHSYECLSYVWGTEEYRKCIEIDIGEAVLNFPATPNLYEALLHIRDPVFEQILWIDAICINQDDDEEKATQVAAMARIYGLAKRVVVWLGPEAEGSTLAFEELRNQAQSYLSADRSSSDETKPKDEATALLRRPYFRRMWILQEVTAARNILFKCGDAELQTSTFIAGLDALKRLDDWQIRGRILPFLNLIKSSAFRESLKGQTHLNIEPLTTLIDQFHTHDASNPLDKIYALWGLCSDSQSMTRLQPDYRKSWETLLKDLGKIVFGDHSTIAASKDRQMM
ncbi:HET-domain-containing protein, partial [Karstenula rhodostoma CBS 690.94]